MSNSIIRVYDRTGKPSWDSLLGVTCDCSGGKYLRMRGMNDKIEKFYLKSPFFEMDSTLKEKIENVQTDVNESKPEIGD